MVYNNSAMYTGWTSNKVKDGSLGSQVAEVVDNVARFILLLIAILFERGRPEVTSSWGPMTGILCLQRCWKKQHVLLTK